MLLFIVLLSTPPLLLVMNRERERQTETETEKLILKNEYIKGLMHCLMLLPLRTMVIIGLNLTI